MMITSFYISDAKYQQQSIRTGIRGNKNMPTGACGINCDVCRLNTSGACSSCGSGTSEAAAQKIEVQKHLFGRPCPILACAQLNQIEYCLKDCKSFPCHNFENGPYPFSQAYLNMQARRREQLADDIEQKGDVVIIPEEYWKDLKALNHQKLAKQAMVQVEGDHLIRLPFLKRDIMVDLNKKKTYHISDRGRQTIDYPLLKLIILVYLRKATSLSVADKLISFHELKSADFFKGPHTLNETTISDRYGNDFEGFEAAAKRLGGEPVDMADAAFKLQPFPKVPLYYLIWTGDNEFPAQCSILFDRTIENQLAADAIWGLIMIVNHLLLNKNQDIWSTSFNS